MENSKYWEKRIAKETWKTYNSLEEKNRAVFDMYKQASEDISNEVYKIGEKLKTATPSLSDMHKYKRLNQLKGNIDDIVKELSENVQKHTIQTMQWGFKEVYQNTGIAIGIDFAIPDEKLMESMLNRPWLGSNFSKRLWGNASALEHELNSTLRIGLQQGKTVTEMAIALDGVMKKGFNAAHRLVRTESMHYMNTAAIQGYKDAGVKTVRVWAAGDERTCSTCKSYHDKVYPIEKVPVLPLHANCRCTILPEIDINEQQVDDSLQKLMDEGIIKSGEEHSETYKELVESLKKNKVEHREAGMLSSTLTNDEIVNRLAGGDMTKGSCSSLGFAYIGNKNGYDVIDFRGGKSQEFFSITSNIKKMLDLPNVKGSITMVEKEAADTAKIIKSLEFDKEYYIAVGRHAAIIRNTKQGAEYLELQSKFENGWTAFKNKRYGLTSNTLYKRFGCRKTADKIKIGGETKVYKKQVILMEVDSFKGNDEFKGILGYINTNADNQMKGAAGGVK